MCSSIFMPEVGVAQAIEEHLKKAVGICPSVYPLSI